MTINYIFSEIVWHDGRDGGYVPCTKSIFTEQSVDWVWSFIIIVCSHKNSAVVFVNKIINNCRLICRLNRGSAGQVGVFDKINLSFPWPEREGERKSTAAEGSQPMSEQLKFAQLIKS